MKIDYKTNLKLGSTELERSQKLISGDSLQTLQQLISKFGLIISQQALHTIGTEWKAIMGAGGSTYVLTVNAGSGIFQDTNGYPKMVSLSTMATLNAPTTPATYHLVASYISVNTEIGTVAVVNSSANIVGSGTEFTKIFGVNRNIIINNLLWQILSVTDDTHLTLASPYTGVTTSGLTFMTGGWFAGGYPSNVSDNLIYEYNGVQLTFKTTSLLSTDYWIADVIVGASAITDIHDQRDNNILKLISKDLVSSSDGVFALTTQTHTQASTTVYVGEGQTKNFPASSSDNSVFLRTSIGASPFTYTSKSSSRFFGVSFYASPFTSNIGDSVYRYDSVSLESSFSGNYGGLRVGDSLLSLIPPSFFATKPYLHSDDFWQLLHSLLILGNTLAIGQNAASQASGTGVFDSIYFIVDEVNKIFNARFEAMDLNSNAPGQKDVVFDLNNAASGYGNYYFQKNGVKLFGFNDSVFTIYASDGSILFQQSLVPGGLTSITNLSLNTVSALNTSYNLFNSQMVASTTANASVGTDIVWNNTTGTNTPSTILRLFYNHRTGNKRMKLTCKANNNYSGNSYIYLIVNGVSTTLPILVNTGSSYVQAGVSADISSLIDESTYEVDINIVNPMGTSTPFNVKDIVIDIES